MTHRADAEQWARAERLFAAAIALPDEQRATFIAEATGDDDALRALLETLLANDAPDDDHLQPGTGARRRILGLPDPPAAGDHVGPWRLLERIGSGGAGEVFRAERLDRDDTTAPDTVALKLLRRDLAHAETRRRFETEVRSLERLEHPGIARLLDAGVDPEGRGWLAMEFIDGEPIDVWCDARRVSVPGRLRLVEQVARAVQHAHTNLVVHRDIKPSNVLVREDGTPILLDFGIAKLLQSDDSGRIIEPTQTLTRHRMLTPEYASPEQILGERITASSDVYALGALLYLLLTGTTPLALGAARPGELERLVRDRLPRRPSHMVDPRTRRLTESRTAGSAAPTDGARMTVGDSAPLPGSETANRAWRERIAACRSSQPDRLRRDLRGDIDTIVLTCLRKEPNRRYPTADALAADLERTLAGEAIVARPESRWRAARRLVRRHRPLVVTAALIFVSMLAATIISLRAASIADSARRAEAREARHAAIEATSAQRLSGFLAESVIAGLSELEPDRLGLVRDLIDTEARAARRQFATDDHLRANILHGLGTVAVALGADDDADALLTEAHAIRVEHFGANDVEVALSLTGFGHLAWHRGDFDAAAEAFAGALAIHRAHDDHVHGDLATAAHDLGATYRRLGRPRDARRLLEEALAMRRAADPPAPAAVAESLAVLGALALDERDFPTAARLAEETLDLRRAVYGPTHPAVGEALNNLAVAAGYGGDLDRAATIYADAVTCYEALGGAGLAGLARTLPNLAQVHMLRDQPDAARRALDAALGVTRQRHGAGHPEIASILNRLAVLNADSGALDRAVEQWDEALAIQRAAYGDRHAVVGRTLYTCGLELQRHGRTEAALARLDEAAAALDERDPYWHALTELARVEPLRKLGRSSNANVAIDRARQLLNSSAAPDDPAFAALQRLQDAGDAP